jgi:maltose O-acetyltransferase
MSEKRKMLEGDLFQPSDAEIQADIAANKIWLDTYNATTQRTAEARFALLQKHLGRVGAGAAIRPPFFCDYGYNIRLGDNVFLNFNCIILDAATVSIGDRTKFGPSVQIYTSDHPRDPDQRRTGLELGRPVIIGQNVWIGGGAIILPGVTIEDDALIGAGAVVTHNVERGARVAGNPAKKIP